jgi:hypothetical protein
VVTVQEPRCDGGGGGGGNIHLFWVIVGGGSGDGRAEKERTWGRDHITTRVKLQLCSGTEKLRPIHKLKTTQPHAWLL